MLHRAKEMVQCSEIIRAVRLNFLLLAYLRSCYQRTIFGNSQRKSCYCNQQFFTITNISLIYQ